MKISEVVRNLDENFLHPVCIVNCDLPDRPLTYVNNIFCQQTGYKNSASIGKNCRFLLGPKTDKDAVSRVRHATTNRKAICQNLVNYKADGKKFYNRLVLIPFKKKTTSNFP